MNWYHLFIGQHGRIPRMQFWAGIGAIIGFQLLVQAPVMSHYGIDLEKGIAPLWFRNLSLFLDVICAWPMFAVLAKRQEDRDQDPYLSWLVVALLLIFSILDTFALTQQDNAYTLIGYASGLPLLGMIGIALFELGCRRGTEGPNRFGPDPLS